MIMAQVQRDYLFGRPGGLKLSQEEFQKTCRRVGCKGPNPFAVLPYLDLSCLFVVPTGHALLFGAVSNFVDYMLRPLTEIKPMDPDRDQVISREDRRRIAERGSFITVTSDFGRRYKCVLQYRRSYRMEDWLHFAETFSAYVFKGSVLPEALRELWWMLVDVVVHYFRPRPADETKAQFLAASKAASNKLLLYSQKLVELCLPGHLCTINLHILNCWLPEQEVQLGSASAFTDLCVERVMQTMKSQGGRMVTHEPEKHYAQWLCLLRHAESLTAPDPRTGVVLTTNQQLQAMLRRRTADHGAEQFDSKGGVGYLLGPGNAVCNEPQRQSQVRGALQGLIKYYASALADVRSWSVAAAGGRFEVDETLVDKVLVADPAGTSKARYFLRAEAPDEVRYFSAEYGRQQKRCSNWAVYVAEEEVGAGAQRRVVLRTYVAYLKYFVHLPAVDHGASIRFAVADVYTARVFAGNLAVVDMAKAHDSVPGDEWEMWRDIGVPIQELKGKVCFAAPSGNRQGFMYFMPYMHLSDR